MGTPQMCGTTREGATYCWGYNVNGELGDGTTSHRGSPARVDASVTFRALASSYHTCGITTEGVAYCWGSGNGGQLGTGDDKPQLRPARVQSSAAFKSITNGMQFSCALTLAGDAQCWGWGAGLGSGIIDRSVNVPTPVSGGLTYRSISAGEEHVCAASTGGEVYCWGKLLAFDAGGFRAAPTRIPGSVRMVTVVSGSRMVEGGASCGLTEAGEAYCWHSGLAPVRVPGGYRYAGLAGGHSRFCGYTPGGAAFCWTWDQNAEGQLALTAPEPIPAL
jgi:alpha-tubulin suppressor-like RCC1 family protein